MVLLPLLLLLLLLVLTVTVTDGDTEVVTAPALLAVVALLIISAPSAGVGGAADAHPPTECFSFSTPALTLKCQEYEV